MRLTEKQYRNFMNKRLEVKQNKYHNKKVVYDGYKFDSQKERDHYIALKQLQQYGFIKELKLQVPFLLIDTVRHGGKTYPKTKYIADFTYIKDDKLVVEDVKSTITRKDKVYRLKIKLLLSKYPDIEFKEIM